MIPYYFFDRDLSWLSFNERVLEEAGNSKVPVMERIKFLSIYSSNLDEFYRVRMPVITALTGITDTKIKSNLRTDTKEQVHEKVQAIIKKQLVRFGSILTRQLIPELHARNIQLVYNEKIPELIQTSTTDFFFVTLAAFLKITFLHPNEAFFPENNKLYFAVLLTKDGQEKIAVVNIPSDAVSRFYSTRIAETQYILFIDDIIKSNLTYLFPSYELKNAYCIKITRDADLNLEDELEGDLAEKIERQISQRDQGSATRFLYQSDLPEALLYQLSTEFGFSGTEAIAGGNYHNLSDLGGLPVAESSLFYPRLSPVNRPSEIKGNSLLSEIEREDILLHTPYHSYDTVLRFFSEAAISPEVVEISTTLYRVARDSRIVQALATAAQNGKKVTVFVELKARFDEANNIKWAKHMKEAGVRIIYSIPDLKVHAKVALLKREKDGSSSYSGLLATGNLNETTARFYTDHILLTSHSDLVRELNQLFNFLTKRKKADSSDHLVFNHLLVAQFNLHRSFIDLIDHEIANAQEGLPAMITIKLNNLEEEILIRKLYEASNSGVRINLIIRGICRLVPGVPGMSETISVRRIVDRYLEHGRIFIFHNNNQELIFMGSSDWMNRNIYNRIEVSFPLYNERLKKEIRDIIDLQLRDTGAAVMLDQFLANQPIHSDTAAFHSQEAIYNYLANQFQIPPQQ